MWCSEAAAKDGRTLQGLGVEPQAIEAIVPTYLYRYRKTGQYQAQRLGAEAAPDVSCPAGLRSRESIL